MAHKSIPTIHDRLAAYAAERRRQMGAPWALPPDTRRTLLAAVVRPERSWAMGAPSRWIGWLGLWPRWGGVAAVCSFLLVAGSLWLVFGPRQARPLETARYDARLTNQPVVVAPLHQVPSEVPAPTRAAPTLAVRPASPPSVQGAPELAATSGRATESRPATPTAPRRESHPAAPVPTPTAKPRTEAPLVVASAPAADVRRVAEPSPKSARQTYRQVAAAGKSGQAKPKAGRTPLADRFRVESDGSVLRIIDTDGSVYQGAIVTAVPFGDAAGVAESAPSPGRKTPGDAPAVTRSTENLRYGLNPARARPTTLRAAASESGELAFEVSGTNLTSRLPVQVRGSLIVTNRFASGLGSPPLSEAGRLESHQVLLRNSILHAEVVLGGGQAASIEAVPVDR